MYTLLTLSRNSNISLDDRRGWTILDPTKGARQFNAIVTEPFLSELFGEEPRIDSGMVVRAFQKSTAISGRYRTMGYNWDPTENRLSTTESAILHPEVTLIQHLLANGEKGETYIACSKTPCYASSVYATAVNECHGTRFTMHIDEPEWSQLYDAGPWILPENTEPDVTEKMKQDFFMALRWFMDSWACMWPDQYAPR